MGGEINIHVVRATTATTTILGEIRKSIPGKSAREQIAKYTLFQNKLP